MKKTLAMALLASAMAVATSANATVYDQAVCLVKANPAAASAFAASLPNSDAERTALARFGLELETCVEQHSLNDDSRVILGGAVAAIDAKTYSPVTLRYSGVSQKKMDIARVSEQSLARTANWPPVVAIISCAVSRDRKTADEVLASKAGSARENRAFKRFSVIIEHCIEKGKDLAVTPVTARAIIQRNRYSSGFTYDPFLAASRGVN